MKNFKVKLISLPQTDFGRAYPITTRLYSYRFLLPYGLGILTTFLRDNNYNVILNDLAKKIEDNIWFSLNLNILTYENKIIDYVCGHSWDRRLEYFSERITQITDCKGYDLIGISVMGYFQFLFALLLCRKIKSMSNTKVVLGGPFITIYREKLFEQFYIGDYMIVGDGQVPLLKLIEHLEGKISIGDVPNLLYRQDGAVRANSRKFFHIEDLCVPDFSDLPLGLYKSTMHGIGSDLPYQISRGCTNKCSFCSRSLITPFVEFKSYNKVVTELKSMKERYQNNSFRFLDDTINCSYEYLDKLCDIFIEKKLNIFWSTLARADNLDRKILHKMKKSGCTSLSFGIESGSNKILRAMRKDFNIEQAAKVLRNSYKEGIKNEISLLSGFPHEKEVDIIETIEFIRKNSEYIDRVSIISPLRVEYNTPLYRNPEMFGIENLRCPSDIPQRIKFKHFAFDEINGLRWEEKVRQEKYFRKMIMKANFKYILPKQYRLSFIPFCLYFWLTETENLSSIWWFSRLFKRFILYLYRKRP